MRLNSLRTVHPVVLILTVTIMVFGLLLSVLLTGMIPAKTSVSAKTSGNVGVIQQSGQKEVITLTQFSNAGSIISSEKKAIYIPIYKNASKAQAEPMIKLNPSMDDELICASCGEIVSINLPKQQGQGYMIKVHMEDGSYRMISQYREPDFSVGDEVKLNSRKFTLA
jgi:hypothetical protein